MKPAVAALAVGVLLAGCAERAPEVTLRPASPHPVAAPAPILTATPDPLSTYAYVPSGKRDPFHEDVEPRPTPPSLECLGQPLCRYSLDELKLTGIISGMGNPVAVLESPQGKGYSVYRGSMVGKHGGVVKQILRDAVVVVESWPDAQGFARKEEIVLRMRADVPLQMEE